MKEYIERKALLEELAELYDNIDPRWQRGRDARLGLTMAKKVIENHPTADVQEVRHGEWVKKYLEHNQYLYRCSCCSAEVGKYYIEDFGHKNFCPVCGAKMVKK